MSASEAFWVGAGADLVDVLAGAAIVEPEDAAGAAAAAGAVAETGFGAGVEAAAGAAVVFAAGADPESAFAEEPFLLFDDFLLEAVSAAGLAWLLPEAEPAAVAGASVLALFFFDFDDVFVGDDALVAAADEAVELSAAAFFDFLDFLVVEAEVEV